MEIPFSGWHAATAERRSRRRFDPDVPVAPEAMAALGSVCREFSPFPGVRSCLTTGSAERVFRSVIGGYGKIRHAPAFVAFIGNMDDPLVQEKVGYTGEGIILEATALGLNTCWVGGFFRRDVVASIVGLSEREQILAVTPVGHAMTSPQLGERLMTGLGRLHNRLPLSRLTTGLPEEEWPAWARAALEAARLAPSAVNRQPWIFDVQPDAITVSVRTRGPRFRVSKRLDCGLAMLHLEVAAGDCGCRGEWEFLPAPEVARFRVGS